MGYAKIARTLTERNIPARFGGTWSNSTVQSILLNEKYAGDMLLQKSFCEDFRTKKKRKNTGEMRRVFVKNSHEAIIDRATFEATQREIARRSQRQRNVVRKNGTHDNSEKFFTGLIICGDCGCRFQRKYTNSKTSDKPIWICMKYHKYSTAACHSQKIPEAILIEKTKEVLETSELSQDIIKDRIKQILVPEHNHLLYALKDGSQCDVFWQHPSRSLSWTPEMREAARQRAIEQAKKGESK